MRVECDGAVSVMVQRSRQPERSLIIAMITNGGCANPWKIVGLEIHCDGADSCIMVSR